MSSRFEINHAVIHEAQPGACTACDRVRASDPHLFLPAAGMTEAGAWDLLMRAAGELGAPADDELTVTLTGTSADDESPDGWSGWTPRQVAAHQRRHAGGRNWRKMRH